MGTQYNQSQKSRVLSRRTFLKQSVKATVGLTLAGSSIPDLITSSLAATAVQKSKVVLIRHTKVIDSAGKIQKPILQEMLDLAITTFTDKKTLADAWSQFFTPEDVIGLKINANSLRDYRETDMVSHYTALTSAIMSGCRKSGIKDSNFVIWERSEEELDNAGYKVKNETGALRVMGTKKARREPDGIGFSSESFPVGNGSTHISKILADICSSMINIPVLKDHGLSGVTGALKNHYGSIDNPGEFHENACTSPGIPEINAIPMIRKKQRLIVADLLFCTYNEGPRWRRDYFWPYGGIIVGTDPVAVDWVMMKLLDEKRQSEGLTPIEPRATHLALAEKLGLGTQNPENINLIKTGLS